MRFLLLLFSIVAPVVYGGVVVFEWDPPTTYTDGTEICCITGLSYRVYSSPILGEYTNVVSSVTTTTASVNFDSTGRTFFVVTAVDSLGAESDPSKPLCISFLPPTNVPPVDLRFDPQVVSETNTTSNANNVLCGSIVITNYLETKFSVWLQSTDTLSQESPFTNLFRVFSGLVSEGKYPIRMEIPIGDKLAEFFRLWAAYDTQ